MTALAAPAMFAPAMVAPTVPPAVFAPTVSPAPVVVLVAHGSRESRAGDATRALARAVAVAEPAWRVRVAFLELAAPHLGDVLAGIGATPAVVVPLLLTPAYHARTDVPGIVAGAVARGARIAVAPVLGPAGDTPEPALIRALTSRLADTFQAVVLAAAGSREPRALASVDAVASALGAALGVPCRAGYASGIGPTVAETVAGLRADGVRTVAMAAHFVAPGLLYDRAVTAAVEAGVTTCAAPLGDAADLVTLVRRRAIGAVAVPARSIAA
jgi:sirohydrochlorin ferrochelatase